jgi:hypothetical protein
MGRYYTGDICGKFWFGIQNSDDADHFGCKGNIVNYRFYGCECSINQYLIDIAIENKVSLFCDKCYHNYNHHKKEVEDLVENNILYYECCEQLIYEFNSTHINIVKQVLNELENKYSMYIKNFEIIDDVSLEDGIDYEVDLVDEKEEEESEDKKILKYVARLCLGRQILYCLEKNGKCNFTGEI